MVLATSLLGGCGTPNTYGTPRTVPPGRVAHTHAVEAATVFRRQTDAGTGDTKSARESAFTSPTYIMRIGLAERLDVGLHLSNPLAPGAEAKWNFAQSDVVDAAIAPGAQWMPVNFEEDGGERSVSLVYLHAPLLVGFNLSEAVTLVVVPGMIYGIGADVTPDRVLSSGMTQTGCLGYRCCPPSCWAAQPGHLALLFPARAKRSNGIGFVFSGSNSRTNTRNCSPGSS